ncbi:DMT family transporter [soil metagenome]
MIQRLSPAKSSRPLAIAESMVATLIWASSFIIAQYGMGHIGPLTMAGLRYPLAGLLMLPFLFRGQQSIRHLSAALWGRLFGIGLFAHALGNGAIFFAFNYLSATTLTFVSCFLPIPVLLIGIVQLGEFPSLVQLIGLVITLVGSSMFFSGGLSGGEWIGIVVASFGLICFSYSTILSRGIARHQQTSTLALTALPLIFGGLPLLGGALLVEGLPTLTPLVWGVVIALAVLNTVVAYSLYYHSMQVLTAFESNIFLNLAPLGTAVLAWYLFGEKLGLLSVVGIVIVIIGVTLVQWQPQGVRLVSAQTSENAATNYTN